jgi:transcriptional regulator with XRE-family HTH domain
MTRLQVQLRERLLDALARRHMSQADLARAAGISQKHLSQLMTGHAEGTLTMWQDLFDATSHRVDVRVARKPRVTV